MINPLENNDCAVRALAFATGTTYAAAYSALSDNGRIPGEGATVLQIYLAAKALGFRLDEVSVTKTATTSKISKKLGSLPAVLLVCEDHVACAVCGEIMDWSATEALPVVSAYAVSKA